MKNTKLFALSVPGRRGWLSLPSGVLASFLVVLVVVVATGAVRVANIRTLNVSREAVAHSYAVKGELQALLGALVDAETGERGFIITNNATYLEPYDRARAAVADDLARVRNLLGDDASTRADLEQITALAREKLDELVAAIRAMREQGFAAAQAAVLTNKGKQTMDAARRVVARLNTREDARLAARTATAARSYRIAQLTGLGSSLIALLAVGVLFVMTRRLGAERLQAAEVAERLHVTLASIGDAVIATDDTGRIIWMNAIAEGLTGWAVGDASGRPVQEVFVIINEDTRRPAENPIVRVLRERIVMGLANHTVLIARDGREIPVEDSAAPIKTEDGYFAGVVMVFRDVTDRRRIEKEHADALEREQAAHALADSANRAKDQFVAMISHELRTPLNAILGWADLARRGMLPDDRRERALEKIFMSAKRQEQLISELLDISRIISGKLRLDRALMDLPEVVRIAIEIVAASAKAKHIRMSVEIDPSLSSFYGDAARLQQVVWNLLSNAIKFTPDGGSVRVTLRHLESGVELVVSDTGQGIPQGALQKIFEPFHQADHPTTRPQEGLGLGLAIVRHLVEAHNGVISAESSGEGRGAAFRVRLPIAPAYAGNPLPPVLETTHTVLSGTTLDGVSVLVVDDDETSRDLLVTALEAHGARAMSAASAADGLQAIAEATIDAVVSDIAMPKQDGYAFIRAIRTHAVPSVRTLPAIALTSFARSEDQQRALEAGYSVHIAKPIDIPTLIELVGTMTSRMLQK